MPMGTPPANDFMGKDSVCDPPSDASSDADLSEWEADLFSSDEEEVLYCIP